MHNFIHFGKWCMISVALEVHMFFLLAVPFTLCSVQCCLPSAISHLPGFMRVQHNTSPIAANCTERMD